MRDRLLFFFFFQAEDGIRSLTVTGVQTCALPISRGNLVGDQPIEPALRPGSGDLVLGERGEIDEAHALAHEARFVPHVLEIVAAPETPAIPALYAWRGEPVGTLPAIALSPHRALGIDQRVHRTGLRGPCVGALLVREVDDEHVAVGFFILFDDIALAGVRAEAAWVHRQHVDPRLALDDPLGELPAGAAGGGDAEAVALVEPYVAQPPGGSDERAAIGAVGDRSIDDVLDAAVLQRWHPARGRLDVRHQAIEIAGKEAAPAPVGNAEAA